MKNQEILTIIVDKSGLGVAGGKISFMVISTQPMSDRSLAVIQELYGFDPAGYGMNPIMRSGDTQASTAIWTCSATAD
jgi:hypothetical protein